jgi:hypothetical protein
MKTSKKLKWILISIGVIMAGGISVALYFFYMPHRNVHAAKADLQVTAASLIEEFLADQVGSNQKYLSEDGDSKILNITGHIQSIEIDFNRNYVVILGEMELQASVSCTFDSHTNKQVESLQIGQNITVKGVLRSGARYDEDLGLFLPVIIEKTQLFNVNDK